MLLKDFDGVTRTGILVYVYVVKVQIPHVPGLGTSSILDSSQFHKVSSADVILDQTLTFSGS